MLKVKREREAVLRESLEEGIKSGYYMDLDVDSFCDELERKYVK